MAQRYTQCRLIRGRTKQVAWIPTELAVKGKVLEIKGERGWRVIGVGATVDESYVKEHERDYLKQREASDV